MSNPGYSEDSLHTQVLVDEDQWARLKAELGEDLLLGLAQEFFQETAEIWLAPGQSDQPDNSPFGLEEAKFRSAAHRTAGAAGTLGFLKLACAFWCMEHATGKPKAQTFLEPMTTIFRESQDWLRRQAPDAVC